MATNLLPLNTRVPPKLHAEVVEFRRQKPDIPSLAATVHELISIGMQTVKRREQKQPQTTTR
jgi:hypothetical protein